jgi:tripartite-type tricarboxylate transporter receptor subunit TctC
MLAPAGTPPAIIQRVSAVLLSALKSPEVRGPLLKQGAIIVGGSPDAFPAYYAKESGKWGEIIRSRGISLK